jgi:hypothetical protein
MDEMDEEEHSPLILVLPEFESSGNTANLTKPTCRMVLGDVALRSIVADLVLQWYLPRSRSCGGGDRNHHCAEE